ncbi:ArsR/SmtB family transcription factor [Segeticoccus rhizosphaerae]|jgi:DNA-binding transcriptional ArsR family regulator|uniref:ArsR/SmtB family transcription factor n=1 Tax=Segeticoccus rhizosphaerae TaxID=1104777 RepID=UPI0010C09A16|nr:MULTISPECIES: helix-turn-helix domain-containing protein [Intrasporangiaceae]
MPETETPHDPDGYPVASIQSVLAALSDPVRLEMVRRLDAAGAAQPCSLLYDEVSKSTASHHFKILREAGVLERSKIGGQVHQRLRRAEVDALYPGLLDSVTAALG